MFIREKKARLICKEREREYLVGKSKLGYVLKIIFESTAANIFICEVDYECGPRCMAIFFWDSLKVFYGEKVSEKHFEEI